MLKKKLEGDVSMDFKKKIKELEESKKYLETSNDRLRKNRDYHKHFSYAWATILFLSLGLILVISNFWSTNWDENAYCLEKLKTNFPEYNFVSATFSAHGLTNGYFCDGDYPTAKALQRDGLRSETETASKSFELISQVDKDWVSKDDGPQGVLLLGGLLLIAAGITIWYWIKFE
jgi:hypothetical protein